MAINPNNKIKFVAHINENLNRRVKYIRENMGTNEGIVIAGIERIEERISILKNRSNESKPT